MERNQDGRVYRMVDGERAKVNFIISYEMDGSRPPTVLRASEYGGDEDHAWMLLKATDGAATAPVEEE